MKFFGLVTQGLCDLKKMDSFAVRSKQTHLASERPSQPPDKHVDGALLDAKRGRDRPLHRVHVLR